MCAPREAQRRPPEPIGCTRMTALLGYPRIRHYQESLGTLRNRKSLSGILVSEKEGIHSARIDLLAGT